MVRLPALCGFGILVFALLVGGAASQDAKKDSGDKKETGKAKGMLPPGFKDLGLSKDQVAKIYAVQADYKTKIADLDKQIKEMKKQEQQDVFKVLTDDQRDKYLKSKGFDVKKADEKKTADKKPDDKDKKPDDKDKK